MTESILTPSHESASTFGAKISLLDRYRRKRLAFLYIFCNAILAANMLDDSFEGFKIVPVVRSNTHLHNGDTHKGDCGVDKIPLLQSATLVINGVS